MGLDFRSFTECLKYRCCAFESSFEVGGTLLKAWSPGELWFAINSGEPSYGPKMAILNVVKMKFVHTCCRKTVKVPAMRFSLWD